MTIKTESQVQTEAIDAIVAAGFSPGDFSAPVIEPPGTYAGVPGANDATSWTVWFDPLTLDPLPGQGLTVHDDDTKTVGQPDNTVVFLGR